VRVSPLEEPTHETHHGLSLLPAAGATLAPWRLWTCKVDPPGNALPKNAFADTFGFGEPDVSLRDTVIRAYRADTSEQWLKRKVEIVDTWLGTYNPIKGSHLGWAEAALP
jgi:hypothetical protein